MLSRDRTEEVLNYRVLTRLSWLCGVVVASYEEQISIVVIYRLFVSDLSLLLIGTASSSPMVDDRDVYVRRTFRTTPPRIPTGDAQYMIVASYEEKIPIFVIHCLFISDLSLLLVDAVLGSPVVDERDAYAGRTFRTAPPRIPTGDSFWLPPRSTDTVHHEKVRIESRLQFVRAIAQCELTEGDSCGYIYVKIVFLEVPNSLQDT